MEKLNINKLNPIDSKNWVIFQGKAVNEYLYYNYSKNQDKSIIHHYLTNRYGET